MNINVILAATPQGGIGYKNTIPWRLKGDLKRFKEYTMGKVLIMGRNTFESLPKPLDGRVVVVVSKTLCDKVTEAIIKNPTNYEAKKLLFPQPGFNESVFFKEDLTSALELAEMLGYSDVWIAGGAKLYEEAFKLPCVIYLTLVYKTPTEPFLGYDTWIDSKSFLGSVPIGDPKVIFENNPNTGLCEISHVYQTYWSKIGVETFEAEHVTKTEQINNQSLYNSIGSMEKSAEG